MGWNEYECRGRGMSSVQKLCLERTQNLSALPVRLAANSVHQKAMALVGLVIVYLRFIDGTLVEKPVVLTLLIYCRKGRDDFSAPLQSFGFQAI